MVSTRRILGLFTGIALAAGTGLAAAPSASASSHNCPPKPPAHAPGTASLASVLLSDGNQFDHNWKDYDIVTEAVVAVLKAKPNSPVKVLTDGNVALTTFAPTDAAFQRLVKDISGKWVAKEKDVFGAVAGLGIDTVETVLLYHVVPGATITAKDAAKANGARLTTAQGGKITVMVGRSGIRLGDADRNSPDPRVVAVDINKGNKQIAHGINRVLRPIDLPH
ncbi:MAG: fasciclin domain-containing protein [Kineosporiaceae bacterium]